MAWSALTLPKRPLHDTVPVPSVYPIIPKTGLPSWNRLPRDAKLPMPRCPKGEVPLSRGNVCEEVRRSYRHHKFSLWDPNNFKHPGDVEYHSIYDHYLRHYFVNLSHFTQLLRHAQITPNGQALCELRTYNKYRQYLYNLWALEVDRLVKTQIKEEKLLLEAIYQDALGKHGQSASAARRRWMEYQDELKWEYGKFYPEVSQWLQETSRCYRNATQQRVAQYEAREAKLREKWDKQKAHDIAFYEEECRIRREAALDERRRKERRMKEFQKHWNAHQRKLAIRKAKRKNDTKKKCEEAERVIKKFREEYARELDAYERSEGIENTALPE